MRLIAVIVPSLLLSGCFGSLPKWPDIPEGLDKPCPELKLVPKGTTELSDMLNVINDNYAEYHKCKAKIDLWNKWYQQQKKNYEDDDF